MIKNSGAADHVSAPVSANALAATSADPDVIIIGAGPAGLFCAREASRRGLRVLVADRQAQTGRKLAMAGGGMGNITNRALSPEHYVGENPDFCRNALRAFGTDAALALLDELNIPWEERDFGQIFCLKPASLFGDILEKQCRDAGVHFLLGEPVSAVHPPSSLPSSPENNEDFSSTRDDNILFHVRVGGSTYAAPQLVLATGSPAWPQAGSSDFGVRLAARWGHRIVPFCPALSPLLMPQDWPLLGLEGISINARLDVLPATSLVPSLTSAPSSSPTSSTASDAVSPADFTADPGPQSSARGSSSNAQKNRSGDPWPARPLLFTHKGLSGPAALVASCFLREGSSLRIDFLPGFSVLDLLHQPENGKLLVRNLLARHLPARLADRLVPPDLAGRKAAEVGKKDRIRLAAAVHSHGVTPAGCEGMRKAEAAAGGVAVDALTRHLESRFVPGLFFCGELIDITGLLGGYNIHWALASAFIVGNQVKPIRF